MNNDNTQLIEENSDLKARIRIMERNVSALQAKLTEAEKTSEEFSIELLAVQKVNGALRGHLKRALARSDALQQERDSLIANELEWVKSDRAIRKELAELKKSPAVSEEMKRLMIECQQREQEKDERILQLKEKNEVLTERLKEEQDAHRVRQATTNRHLTVSTLMRVFRAAKEHVRNNNEPGGGTPSDLTCAVAAAEAVVES